MPLYLGPIQPGICQRCAAKVPASQLVNDGRNPQLLVCGDCWDPAHPQERPFVVNDTEGMARFPVSPDLPFDTRPVATVEAIETVTSDAFSVTAAAADGFVGYSDGSIWSVFGSGSGTVGGFTVSACYTDATHQKFVLDLVESTVNPFDVIVVGTLRFELETATIEQISDIRRFSWTCTASPFTAGVLTNLAAQYA